MSVRLRLAAVVLALLLPALALSRWTLASGEVRQPGLPVQLDPWTGAHDQSLGPEALALIEPDAYVMRLYESEGRHREAIYLTRRATQAAGSEADHRWLVQEGRIHNALRRRG